MFVMQLWWPVLLLQDKKKDAVKKVIAAMTVGKDVSMLFTDVVNCMQTDNLELKKLVYLYLINYAKSHPDLAILAVNTFVKVWLSCGRGPLSYTSPFRSMYASTGCSGTCINLDTSL
jgi:hypothetical protein